MKQVKPFFVLTAVTLCFASNSCSQTTRPPGSSPIVFEASTPCNEALKQMLHIPQRTKCDFVKWNLALNYEKTWTPSTFKLNCTYGLAKQGTRGFAEGAETIELKGNLTVDQANNLGSEAMVYKLTPDNSPIILYFLKMGENLLHLLDRDKRPMIGNAAWSFTLNRKDPVNPPTAKLSKTIVPIQQLATDSPVVGIFEGRTPCDDRLRELHGISPGGCQVVKCQLILYQDEKTHRPSTFLLHTIYVGAGDDTKYSTTGKWTIAQGTKNNLQATLYQLNPDKPQMLISLLKADDNILFFLDKNENLLVGNSYTSYTLSRARK